MIIPLNGLTIKVNNYLAGTSGLAGGVDSAGAGATSAAIGGAGGDGARTLFTGTTDVAQILATPDSNYATYTIPNQWPIDSLRAEIKGGGGGSGGTGDGELLDGGTVVVDQVNLSMFKSIQVMLVL